MFDKKCFAGDGKRDFLFAHPIDRPLRVLQMTDIQTMGLQWTRNATRDRQIRGAYFKKTACTGWKNGHMRTSAHWSEKPTPI